MDYKV
jgi:hypothetical protein